MTIKSQKLFMLALMTMGGMTPQQCADKLHMKVDTVRTHMKSELFRAQLVEMRDQVQTDALDAVMKRIDAEGMESLRALVDIRDLDINKVDSKKAGLIAQKRAAAQYLLGDLYVDRKVPKLGSHLPNDDGGIKVSISEDALHDMFQALANFRGEDVSITIPKLPVVKQVEHQEHVRGEAPKKKLKRTKVVVHDAEALSEELRAEED